MTAKGDKHSKHILARVILVCCVMLTACAKDKRAEAKLHYDKGQTLRSTGDLRGALREFQHSAELFPGSAITHTMVGITHSDLEEWGEGAQAFQRAIQLNPGYATAHHRYGYLLEQTGDLQAALREHAESVRLDPNNAAYLVSLGRAQADSGQVAESRTSYEQALRAEPNYPYALLYLGELSIAQGDKDKAIEYLQRSIESFTKNLPNDPGIDYAQRKLAEARTTSQ